MDKYAEIFYKYYQKSWLIEKLHERRHEVLADFRRFQDDQVLRFEKDVICLHLDLEEASERYSQLDPMWLKSQWLAALAAEFDLFNELTQQVKAMNLNLTETIIKALEAANENLP